VVATVEVAAPGGPVIAGQTMQLSAVARNAAGAAVAGKTFTWTSSSDAVAAVGAGGMLTGVTPGTANVTASADGKSGTVTVSIIPVPIASLAVEPGSPQVEVGKALQLTVTARDAAGNPLTGRPVTLVSSNAAVATVNAAMLVQGVSPGTSTITATAEGKTATATVTVVPVPIASLTLEPGSPQVMVGKSVQLTVTARDAAGTPLAGRQVTLITSNTAVATVNAAMQVQGVSPGTATITASAEGKTAVSFVTVVPVPVASVTVTPTPVSVEVGATQQLAAVLRDADGNVLTGRTVTWSTNSAAFVQVSAAGVVTGIASGGPFTITATAEGKTGTAQVTVLPQQPGSILVTRDEVPHSSLSNAVVGLAGPDGLQRERQMGTALSLLIDQLPAGSHRVNMSDVFSRPYPPLGPIFTYRAVNNDRVIAIPSGGQAATHFTFTLVSGAVALQLSGIPEERVDYPVPCSLHWSRGASSFAYTTPTGPAAGAEAGLAEVRCYAFHFDGNMYDPSSQAQAVTVPASTTPVTVSVTYTRRP
jgi:uncharacterized protein YjdB